MGALSRPAAGALSRQAAADPSGPTEIVISSNTEYGTVLAVGNGQFKGFSVYFIGSDSGNNFGCTTDLMQLVIGPIQCAGPASDQFVEWPVVLTDGQPVAGPGVNQSLLGEVYRDGVGEQVTYAGHPLYLFDFDTAPGVAEGEDVNEPGLPPWQGVWTLIRPDGLAASQPGQLTTTVINGKTVLAALYETAIAGMVAFPVYTYSRDGLFNSRCDTGACARAFPGVMTDGFPGISGSLFGKGIAGLLRTAGGTQVSWNGRPIYLYANEGLFANDVFHPVGDGDGVTVDGGTFSLVDI